MKIEINQIPKKNLRDIKNWKNAPIPICMGGDYRALTFCCKPGSALTFGFKCQRDKRLSEINITPMKFIQIKEKFSKKHDWGAPETCFDSLSYCCMRRKGCFKRDSALGRIYPDLLPQARLGKYFLLKKKLSQRIMEYANIQITPKI